MLDAAGQFITGGWLYSTLLWIALASTVIIIIVILSENRNPVKSLAWVTVLLLLPVVGIILYLFFGRNIKNRRMISRSNRRRLRRHEKRRAGSVAELALTGRSRRQLSLGRSLTGAQFYEGNDVKVFTDGTAKFDSLIADLEGARKSINLQYYIFADDNIGNRIADVLKRKAAEGLDVRVLYDHVGSLGTSNKFFRSLRRSGVDVHPFFRVTFPNLGAHVNWRNHRKIVTIDGTTGYIGGMNIADRYIDGVDRPWRDTHVRISGPAVAALQFSFAVDWSFTSGQLIDDFASIAAPEPCGTIGAQIVTSGPMDNWSNIAMIFHRAIASAQKRVFIQTPYFLPTEGLLRALESAALAKVDVRLMMPRRSDSRMLSFASASYIAECLRAGIKVYFYDAGMLHAKTLLVDDEMVSIGSANFDFRSFDYNFESNVFFYNRELNEKMARQFADDLTMCHRVEPAVWRRRSLGKKTAESILRLLSPVL